ncbi:Gfo/Idh/MocA family protein [Streptomyces sp. NPDC086091]|uniref:Gfo/Idh/MocA family protein n=1 Tax=Streptomyces sp. NPDC086091 TaxID=3365751 RepID=UPI00381EFAB5
MRIAVVGLGWVAREVWLPRLVKHPDMTVVAVADPRPEAVERAGSLIAGARLCAAPRDIGPGDADLVFVLTPNHTHEAVAGGFLRHGQDVFLEKPTATGADDLARLAESARAGGGRLLLSTAARHRADVGALARLVADGALGTPRLAELSWTRSRGVPAGDWFARRATAGGGVLVDLGWHLVDVLHQIWGAAPIRSATAVASADFLARGGWGAAWQSGGTPARPDADVEDQLTALLATERYGLHLRFAWASYETVDRTRIVLHGTEGTAELVTTFGFTTNRVTEPTLTLRRRDGERTVPLPPAGIGDEYDLHLDALPEALTRPDPTERSLREAHRALAVVDACYRAADTP